MLLFLASRYPNSLWPDREAVRLEDNQKIVSRYEIESYAEVKAQEQHRAFLGERKLRETSERYACKLERLKAEQHPVISTWDTSRICVRAASQAGQYAKSGASDADKFLIKSGSKQSFAKPANPPKTQTGIGEETFSASFTARCASLTRRTVVSQ